MPKILTCRWAATSLDRFAAEDIANLVPGAARSTIDDAISALRNERLIAPLPAAKGRRGRPRAEYTWIAEGREACLAKLEAETSDLDSVREGLRAQLELLTPTSEAVDELQSGLDHIKALVDASLQATDPRAVEELAERARAQYEVLRQVAPNDRRLYEAKRQLERIAGYEPGPAGTLWQRLREIARSSFEPVFDHVGAEVFVAASGWDEGPLEGATMSATSDEPFTIILDMDGKTPRAWLKAYAEQQGHDCMVLRLGEVDVSARQSSYGALLGFFVTPAAFNTQVCMIAKGGNRFRTSVREIEEIFGDRDLVRGAIEMSKTTIGMAAKTIDDADQVISAAAVSTGNMAEPDPLAVGLTRSALLGALIDLPHVSRDALLDATLNGPMIVDASTVRKFKRLGGTIEVSRFNHTAPASFFGFMR